jgi:hypothetical protein
MTAIWHWLSDPGVRNWMLGLAILVALITLSIIGGRAADP